MLELQPVSAHYVSGGVSGGFRERVTEARQVLPALEHAMKAVLVEKRQALLNLVCDVDAKRAAIEGGAGMTLKTSWLVCAVVTGLGPAPMVLAAESQYPMRPIRLIVASAPGGPNDLIARIVGTPWSDLLGKPIVVDNRAGATGMIGTEM